MSNAYQYVKTPAQAAAILNTPFCVIRTMGNEDMKIPAYYDEKELESIYTPVILPDSTATFRPMNVVVLILEIPFPDLPLDLVIFFLSVLQKIHFVDNEAKTVYNRFK